MGNTFLVFGIAPEEDDLPDSVLGQEREVAPQSPRLPLSSSHTPQSPSPLLAWRLYTDLIDV